MSIFNSVLALLNPNYNYVLYSRKDFYFQKSNHGLVNSTMLNSDADFFFLKKSVRSEGNRKPRGAPVVWGRP